jgi:hypothetical protein
MYQLVPASGIHDVERLAHDDGIENSIQEHVVSQRLECLRERHDLIQGQHDANVHVAGRDRRRRRTHPWRAFPASMAAACAARPWPSAQLSKGLANVKDGLRIGRHASLAGCLSGFPAADQPDYTPDGAIRPLIRNPESARLFPPAPAGGAGHTCTHLRCLHTCPGDARQGECRGARGDQAPRSVSWTAPHDLLPRVPSFRHVVGR